MDPIQKTKTKPKTKATPTLKIEVEPEPEPEPEPEKTEKIIILNNDCLIELKNLEDNSIDCVITDPPYFIDKLDNAWSSAKIEGDKKKQSYKASTKRNEIR